MNVDSSDFPFVRMNNDAPSVAPVEELLRQFSDLLARNEAFLFMSEGAFDTSGDNVEDRKKVSLWMKANKGEIRRLVKGHIHVQPDTVKRVAAKAFALISEKFWGYPMFIVATPEEAQEKAAALLAS
ncbi:hypothetical protein HGO34_02190 [Agrobacterium vitis]|uniref:hypothetical protein n=1 Tax=Rhizobium/Agrobacterium group TaxID=227290 RepID=UPI001F2965F6|nr:MULTISPECIES: hypothetical protein [Rhizobium/Agrobacterium group]MCF1501687.1 hypothetical protein [Allorhizobium sp. Av2]MCM2438527.1 hypothetical protein [Agrobacterium vitis]MCM2473136.1 hypothetical protein [Rhizobium sp. CG5]